MSFNKFNIIFFSLIISIIIVGCKTTVISEKDNLKKIPDSFSSAKDSINSANIKWRDYFNDSNLTTLIDIALKNNLDLLSALQKIEIANASFKFRKGALFPDLNLNVAASQKRFGLYTMDGAGNISTEITPGQIVPIQLPDYYVGLQTSWEVDVWGKLRNKKKAALARYLSSIEGKNLIVTSLIAEIANTYYGILTLDNELDIIIETIKLQKSAFELVSIQKEAGAANELAVEQFEAQLLNSMALEFETLQKITESENKINFLLGRFPQSVKRNQLILKQTLPVKIAVGIPSNLLKNRPDIRQAEFGLLQSKADVRAAKAAFYPSFNISAGLGLQAFKTGFLLTTPQSLAYSILGNLVAPLINRKAIKAEFKTANANQQQALYTYQKSIINGYIEVYNQLNNISNLEKIYELKTKEVAVLAKAIETSTTLFKTGRATYIEILMTQKSSLQSKRELLYTRQNQFTATINIYKALGGGWQ
ncbi:MAG: efflux transporter outer membrane subunit [Bacteroidota bacterium]|nr:efflux transporter outer membrane subunit [Bacteroidota bacterium]MDP3145431.1 efflux transporter outer membrane subunit [Bacteroidota bacterium]MDP3557208.1 efflux transporter outer membrane subunit [Bacteroidota bacterium]